MLITFLVRPSFLLLLLYFLVVSLHKNKKKRIENKRGEEKKLARLWEQQPRPNKHTHTHNKMDDLECRAFKSLLTHKVIFPRGFRRSDDPNWPFRT
jgi:hypothetical protein